MTDSTETITLDAYIIDDNSHWILFFREINLKEFFFIQF